MHINISCMHLCSLSLPPSLSGSLSFSSFYVCSRIKYMLHSTHNPHHAAPESLSRSLSLSLSPHTRTHEREREKENNRKMQRCWNCALRVFEVAKLQRREIPFVSSEGKEKKREKKSLSFVKTVPDALFPPYFGVSRIEFQFCRLWIRFVSQGVVCFHSVGFGGHAQDSRYPACIFVDNPHQDR
jgi:hypothetical protein